MINAIPIPAFLVEGKDTLSDANTAFQKLFPKAQIGRSYLTALRQPDLVALIDKMQASGVPNEVEIVLPGRTNSIWRATADRLGDRVLICLQDLNETAIAIQMRQNFVADLSHELKTPLTTISGILETSANDPKAIEHFLPALSADVDRMKRLVGDLLTLSRVEANERRRPNQMINLQAVIEEACSSLASLAQETGGVIQTDLPKDKIQFQADADEIVRAVRNLVENGLRYGTLKGTVTVSGRLSKPSANGGVPRVLIEVSNQGIKVENHHIPRLTERFYRVDGHRSRDTGGSGLGLSIVKHVVTHHRGRLTIESSYKVFHVSIALPQKQAD